MNMLPKTRSDFEVAIVCALPLEADAVQDLFDEYYDDDKDPYGKQPGDPNAYTTGRMGQHHVVLAYMPGMGKVSAASVAASLKISFNRIRLALVVGICGATPFTQNGAELVLGDVIISSAVIEYDFGRQYSDGFQRKTGVKDTLGRPDQEIRSVLSKLETRRFREQIGKKLYQHLEHLQQQPEIMAKYPGAKQDRLYEAAYRHMHHQHPSSPQCLCSQAKSYSDPICEEALNTDCASLGCEGSLIVRRQRDLRTPRPLVHIGTIASASTVVKSAEHRDRVAKKENVIAFEMEGAGVWDNLPCVIIKGVCDYADSHKNKDWQNYAAATGASAAKAFLSFWVPNTPIEEARKKGNEHWIVPRRSNPHFTGREALLQTLKEKLLRPSHGAIPIQQVYVLTGIGGSGKSEVAIKFAEENRDQQVLKLLYYRSQLIHECSFWGVFWIDSTSVAAAAHPFASVAEICGLQDKDIDTVRNHLANVHKPWLLILDNCDDPSEDYSSLLPSAQGSILMTTRDSQSHNAYGKSDSLDELIFEDAVSLLLRSAGVSEKDNHDQEDLAKRVVDLLGCHALAIIQAGAYVSSRLCSLEEYPAVFKSNQKELLGYNRKQMQSRYGNVYTTFEVSAKALESSEQESDIVAISLLSILSFFDRQSVQEEVFVLACEYWQEICSDPYPEDDAIDHLSTWHCEQVSASGIFGQPLKTGIKLFRQARLRLVQLGILSFMTDGATSMHPLIHYWARTRLESKLQAKAWMTAGCILAFSTHERGSYKAFSPVLSPHLESWYGFWSRDDPRLSRYLDIVRVFYALCRQLAAVSNPISVEMARQISAWESQTSHSTSLTKEDVRLLEGRCLYQIGQYEAAIEIREKVLELRTKRLDSEHPDCLMLRYEIARACIEESRYQQAIALLEQVVQIESSTLPPEDSSFLLSRRELGKAYRGGGNYQKAIELLEEVVEIQNRTLKPEHPSRLISQHDLACAYGEFGEHQKAIDLLEEIAKIRSRTLKPEHPDRLASQHELASAYSGIGEHQKAIDLLEQVVKIEGQTLKPEHPSRLVSQHELARAYLRRSDGPHQEAVALLEEVVKIQSWTLKPEHPDRLASQHELARAYLKSSEGPHQEAVALLEEVVKIRSQTLKPEHPDRLTSQHELARAYLESSDGPHQEAVALLEEVVRIQSGTLRPEHPHRLMSQYVLARAYLRSGEHQQAITLLAEVVNMDEKVFGVEHPNTLGSKGLLLQARRGYGGENEYDDDKRESGEDENGSNDGESEIDDNKSKSGDDENESDEAVGRPGNEGESYSLVVRSRGNQDLHP